MFEGNVLLLTGPLAAPELYLLEMIKTQELTLKKKNKSKQQISKTKRFSKIKKFIIKYSCSIIIHSRYTKTNVKIINMFQSIK